MPSAGEEEIKPKQPVNPKKRAAKTRNYLRLKAQERDREQWIGVTCDIDAARDPRPSPWSFTPYFTAVRGNNRLRMTTIYFIQSGGAGPLKIGRSDDPEARLAALQTAHHEKLYLVAAVK